MKNRHFFGLTVEPAFAFMVAALIANSPALAVEAPRQKLAASMTVFDAGSPREAEIKLRPDPKMTVFTPDGQREVAAEPAWPVQQTRAGWLAISTGYRHDNMRFTIGGKGAPNILSELEWQAPALEIRADGGWTHASGATIKGHLAYAKTYTDGKNQDSDYALDNRQAEFSRSYADTTGSEMIDLLLGAGWKLPLGPAVSLTPLLGLARYEGTYRSSNGRQVISDAANASLLGIDNWNAPLGAFDNLHSRYRPVWSSVWLGLDGEFKAGDRLTLRGGVKHHWFKYKAEADWNLRSSFAHPVSFRHEDNGTGWEAEISTDFRLTGAHRLTLDLSKREMKTSQGNDTTFFYNGSSSTIDLGETVLSNWSARLGYRYDY